MEMSQLKIMPIVSCFIRLTGLFLFMALEVTVNFQLKMHSQQLNQPHYVGLVL